MKLFVSIFFLFSFMTAAQASTIHPASTMLNSTEAHQIELHYDVVNLSSDKPYVFADNFQIKIVGNDLKTDSLIKATLYIDHQFDFGTQTRKQEISTVLICAENNTCSGVLKDTVPLVKYGWSFKHWLKISVNGKELIDPWRNQPTFRAVLSLY